jgi:hypothetical protein
MDAPAIVGHVRRGSMPPATALPFTAALAALPTSNGIVFHF